MLFFSLGYFKSYQRKWPTGDVSQVRPRTGWVFVQDKFGGPGEAAQHSYSAWGPGTLHMNGFHRTFLSWSSLANLKELKCVGISRID